MFRNLKIIRGIINIYYFQTENQSFLEFGIYFQIFRFYYRIILFKPHKRPFIFVTV